MCVPSAKVVNVLVKVHSRPQEPDDYISMYRNNFTGSGPGSMFYVGFSLLRDV